MSKKLKSSLLLLLAGATFFSANLYAQSKIEKMTSGETADQNADSTPASNGNSTGADGLKIHSVGLGLGQTFLNSDFQDHGKDKITWDLLYNYSASYSFDLLVDFHSSKFKKNNHYVRTSGLAIGIKGKFYQFDNFSPFIVGGLGFYNPKVKRPVTVNNVETLMESESKIGLGAHFGAGIDLRLNEHVMVGVLGHFHNPFDVQQDLGPEVEGSYFKLLMTGLYSF